MSRKRAGGYIAVACAGLMALVPLVAQPPGPPPGDDKFDVFKGGFGPPGMGPERKILKQFDADGNGWLNDQERKAARESLAKEPRRGGLGKGPPGGMFKGKGGDAEKPRPGPRVSPSEVAPVGNKALFDPTAFRTIFIEFSSPDWIKELEEFRGTDVEVPATLTVDGKSYKNVGIHYRGMSSYMMVSSEGKRSFAVSMDLADENQRLLGAKSLNLLNCHGDPSFMSSVLYSHIARHYIPCPKANFVRVVVNGESWGVFSNVQQFDKIFLAENFGSKKGHRWKVKGSPQGRGGLEYTGDNVADYKRRFELKGDDDEKAWKDLILLCKTLNTTPADKLVEALRPMLDIEGVLWFLALDVTLINSDGYWVRASDFNLYRDEKGVFHVIPHDINECFQGAMGGPGGPPGGGMFRPFDGPPREKRDGPPEGKAGGRPRDKGDDSDRPGDLPKGKVDGPMGKAGGMGGRNGLELDPLVGLDNARTPLRSKLLAVPELRQRYLEHVRTIARDWLDWHKLGPVVATFRAQIENEVAADTRKAESLAAFQRATADEVAPTDPRRRRPEMSLRGFADGRRKYLLEHPAIKALPQAP